MEIVKVISGGQTGVDRAALDVAAELDIPSGGWCPRGRLAEDGTIPLQYCLREAPTSNYAERTGLNVRDSDGTLILTWGQPTNGTAFTIHRAETMERPYLVVDLRKAPPPLEALAWIVGHDIRVLNVAGPRASADPQVYPTAVAWLRTLLQAIKYSGELEARG